MSTAHIAALRPLLAVPGGRVTLEGGPFRIDAGRLPRVTLAGVEARIVFAGPARLSFVVPPIAPAGRVPVRIDEAPGASVLLEVGREIATGFHQVDSPAIGPDGTVYVTCSGSRGQQTPVSIYRVRGDGLREVFVTGLVNATSMAFGPDGRLYVSSRFDGTVSRIDEDGRAEVVASDLGIACGLAFAPDGTMYVGDRSGTVFRVPPGEDPRPFASLPPSIAAFHLAAAADGTLYVTGPTLAPADGVYRIAPDRRVDVVGPRFGRPQGIAVDARGDLYVVEALAGAAGVYRIDGGEAELVLSAPSLVGIAFDPDGGLVVVSNDTAWRFTGLTRV